MTLESEVETQRRTIRTDGYPMSIDELATMYRDDELYLHPEFQRFFRWTDEQKVGSWSRYFSGFQYHLSSYINGQMESGMW